MLKPQPLALTREGFAEQIRAKWSESLLSILEVGRLLIAAKAALPHGEFGEMIEHDLPFGDRAAQMLMAISSHPLLSNPNRGSLLPPSWRTLYELTRLPQPVLEQALDSGKVRPDTSRDEVYRMFRAVQLSSGQIVSPRLGTPFVCAWCGAIDKLGRIDTRDDHENELCVRLYKCGACGKNTDTTERVNGRSEKEYAA